MRTACLLILLLLVTSAHSQGSAAEPCNGATVTTFSGHVCGLLVEREGNGVNAFLGVPYAEPPLGALRFSEPVAHAPWEGVLQATRPGNICPQPPNPLRTEEALDPAPQSEDCLFLNVWAPAANVEELLPVLVYIHGGAFTHGSSTDSPMPGTDWYLQDGSFLAGRQRMVVASFNYRLGALGFLAEAGATGLTGNFGFMDQVLALQWLHHNLPVFGGDPNRVTLAGESAGAMSVGLHLLGTSATRDYFQAAIMQSNPLGITFREQEGSRLTGDSFLVATGCLLRFDQLACLRGLDVETVLAAQEGWQVTLNVLDDGLQGVLPWAPVVDGELITQQPLHRGLQRGSPKPLLIGYTADEGLLFVMHAIREPLSSLLYPGTLGLLFGGTVDTTLFPEYQPGSGEDGREVLARTVDHAVFACPAQALASMTRPIPSFTYRFSHIPSFDLDSSIGQCLGRSCHATELSFVFGTGGFEGGFREEEIELAHQMGGYWSAFTKGVGGLDSLAPWPAWTALERQQLEFSIPNAIVTAESNNCDMWLDWAQGL